MKLTIYILLLTLLQLSSAAQESIVQYRGKMSKIGQEGRLDAAITIDTIKASHLYAIGPVENLRGEIIVWDGKPFVAALTKENVPYVQKNVTNLNAIFLVYADIARWDTVIISSQIGSLDALQIAITKAASRQGIDTSTAFPFLILGKVRQGSGHIMFKDTAVGIVNPSILKESKHVNTFTKQHAQMLGFYSQYHQSIFTHHQTFLHIHYRLGNKYQAGHLDEVVFDETEPLKLLLPHQIK